MRLSKLMTLLSVPLASAALSASIFATATGSPTRRIDGFGKTSAFIDGHVATALYTKEYYCDRGVASKATSGCELGAPAKTPPAATFGTEYGLVPIGFAVPAMHMNCPAKLVCVDHPATLDMTRAAVPLATALKTTPSAIMASLANAPVPGHNHFITTMGGGKPGWWAIKIVGVTSPELYDDIVAHRSFAYLSEKLAAHDPHLLPVTPTNVFLYFSVVPGGDAETM